MAFLGKKDDKEGGNMAILKREEENVVQRGELNALLAEPGIWLDDRLVDEALHGADFLRRMQHSDGYF